MSEKWRVALGLLADELQGKTYIMQSREKNLMHHSQQVRNLPTTSHDDALRLELCLLHFPLMDNETPKHFTQPGAVWQMNLLAKKIASRAVFAFAGVRPRTAARW